MIKVGKKYTRNYFGRVYAWNLERKNAGVYVLIRTLDGKLDVHGESHTRYGTLAEMRREFIRQQMCIDSPYFAGFDKVI